MQQETRTDSTVYFGYQKENKPAKLGEVYSTSTAGDHFCAATSVGINPARKPEDALASGKLVTDSAPKDNQNSDVANKIFTIAFAETCKRLEKEAEDDTNPTLANSGTTAVALAKANGVVHGMCVGDSFMTRTVLEIDNGKPKVSVHRINTLLHDQSKGRLSLNRNIGLKKCCIQGVDHFPDCYHEKLKESIPGVREVSYDLSCDGTTEIAGKKHFNLGETRKEIEARLALLKEQFYASQNVVVDGKIDTAKYNAAKKILPEQIILNAMVNGSRDNITDAGVTFSATDNDDVNVVALFDGHGGPETAQYCAKNIVHILREELKAACALNLSDREEFEKKYREAKKTSEYAQTMQLNFGKEGQALERKKRGNSSYVGNQSPETKKQISPEYLKCMLQYWDDRSDLNEQAIHEDVKMKELIKQLLFWSNLEECDLFSMSQPPDNQFLQEHHRDAYVFTETKIFYSDGKTITSIESDPENLRKIKDNLVQTVQPDMYMSEITAISDGEINCMLPKALDGAQLEIITSTSGHVRPEKKFEDYKQIPLPGNLNDVFSKRNCVLGLLSGHCSITEIFLLAKATKSTKMIEILAEIIQQRFCFTSDKQAFCLIPLDNFFAYRCLTDGQKIAFTQWLETSGHYDPELRSSTNQSSSTQSSSSSASASTMPSPKATASVVPASSAIPAMPTAHITTTAAKSTAASNSANTSATTIEQKQKETAEEMKKDKEKLLPETKSSPAAVPNTSSSSSSITNVSMFSSSAMSRQNNSAPPQEQPTSMLR